VLENAGYEIAEARDGDEALTLAWGSMPDLILPDIQMPGRDGFNVCAELKATPRFANVPMVAMTAGLMRGDKERALSNGFS
jgi:two-component system cell cycle response regulator DivK